MDRFLNLLSVAALCAGEAERTLLCLSCDLFRRRQRSDDAVDEALAMFSVHRLCRLGSVAAIQNRTLIGMRGIAGNSIYLR